MTSQQKRDELIKKFGNKFFDELGERTINGQIMQGHKPMKMDSNALALANRAVDSIYKEWIEDCKHEWTQVLGTYSLYCDKCKTNKCGKCVMLEGQAPCDECSNANKRTDIN